LPNELPREFINYLIVKDTGWTIDYVRNLSVKDHIVYSSLAQCRQKLDVELESVKLKIAANAPSGIF